MDISDSMLWSPSKSLRKLAQEKDIALATAHKAVRGKLKLFPYNLTAVQELKPTDHEKRICYCEWFTKILSKRKLLICLMSPSLQMRPGSTSRVMLTHYKRLWSSENPYAVHEKPLHDQKLVVWDAISRKRTLGLLFFKESVNSKRYCSVVVHDFIGLLEEYQITYS
jgi:hypothetical protein